VKTLVDMLAGGLLLERFPASTLAVAMAGMALLVLVIADWVRGPRLIACVLISTVVVMPWGVKLFMPRYLAFLLPMLFVAGAATLVMWGRALVESRPHREQWRIGAVVVGGIILIAALWYPSRLLERYYEWALANGLSNDGYFRLLDVVSERGACGPRLVVEEVGRPLVNPAWVGLYAVDHVLSLSRCQHALLTLDQAKAVFAEGAEGWAVLSVDSLAKVPPEWSLQPEFTFGAPAGFERLPIVLYRVGRSSP